VKPGSRTPRCSGTADRQQVQARLFPQTLPVLETLEYAGTCIQARQVGGDYYDFSTWDGGGWD